jgi:hypothetical protein
VQIASAHLGHVFIGEGFTAKNTTQLCELGLHEFCRQIRNSLFYGDITMMPDDNLSGISCLSGRSLLMFVPSPTIINMKYCLFLCLMLSFAGISARGGFPEEEVKADSTVRTKTGYATYYARKFEGRKTTSGVRYRAIK